MEQLLEVPTKEQTQKVLQHLHNKKIRALASGTTVYVPNEETAAKALDLLQSLGVKAILEEGE